MAEVEGKIILSLKDEVVTFSFYLLSLYSLPHRLSCSSSQGHRAQYVSLELTWIISISVNLCHILSPSSMQFGAT